MDLGDVLRLVADSPVVDVEPGAAVLVDGERTPAVFVLVEGELEVRRRGRAVVRIGEPGAVVGELGLLLRRPASADVVAVAPTKVHRIEDGEGLIRDSPDFMRFLATMLATRLWQVSTYLSDLQEQFAGRSETLGLVPDVLRELLDTASSDLDPGSEREPDAPY